ncbi:MAG: hypothetical protein M5U09_04475 [Gammaproteobacteria bacterium]|nr:hypothetical protein [Gammaproteobacteria bacterium]
MNPEVRLDHHDLTCDMLHDDVVVAVMRRDGVGRQDLNDLLRARAGIRLNHGHGTTGAASQPAAARKRRLAAVRS